MVPIYPLYNMNSTSHHPETREYRAPGKRITIAFSCFMIRYSSFLLSLSDLAPDLLVFNQILPSCELILIRSYNFLTFALGAVAPLGRTGSGVTYETKGSRRGDILISDLGVS